MGGSRGAGRLRRRNLLSSIAEEPLKRRAARSGHEVTEEPRSGEPPALINAMASNCPCGQLHLVFVSASCGKSQFRSVSHGLLFIAGLPPDTVSARHPQTFLGEPAEKRERDSRPGWETRP